MEGKRGREENREREREMRWGSLLNDEDSVSGESEQGISAGEGR